MKRFHDLDALQEALSIAIADVLSRHGIGSLYAPLAVCAALRVFASPIKYQIGATPLTYGMGMTGFDAYLASKLPAAVEQIKSPYSRIVNPLMDAIAAAIARHKRPLRDKELFRNALRIHLEKPKLTVRGIQAVLRQNGSLEPAFGSARGYLEEAKIIVRNKDGAWELAEEFA